MDYPQKKHAVLGHVVMVVIVLAALVLLFNNQAQGTGVNPDKNLYQVVLLANDQVYYGRLNAVNSNYPYLTDVYYLKQQPAQVDKNGRATGGPDKFTVIKRGIDEIHAPTDNLYIAKEKIFYWENVGADSLVARGIKTDKEWRAKKAEEAKKPVQTQTQQTQQPK